jgi:hypothetical protein
MNEVTRMVAFRDFMESPDGWGRDQGREVYQRLLRFVEANAGTMIFKVSLKDVRRLDISFASETIVELARRYRGAKGFCLIDLNDEDLIENWEAAATKKGQPILVWRGRTSRLLGGEPSPGNREAYAFALSRPHVRAVEFANANNGVSVANASMKFKQLWEQGFLLRRESAADTGGVEFIYHRIG